MAGKAPVKIVRDQLVMGPVTVEFQRTLRSPMATCSSFVADVGMVNWLIGARGSRYGR